MHKYQRTNPYLGPTPPLFIVWLLDQADLNPEAQVQESDATPWASYG